MKNPSARRSKLHRFALATLAALLATFGACTDQQSPTHPSSAAATCTTGVRTNSGKCAVTATNGSVHPRIHPTASFDVSGVAPGVTFTTFDNPDATWTGTTKLIDISGIASGALVTSVADGPFTVTFNTPMKRGDVPATWLTWSSPPNAETATPHVLSTGLSVDGAPVTSATLSLSHQVFAFGFEIEPDPFQSVGFTVTFTFISGGTSVGTVSRTIDGQAGARLIAARSTAAFDQVIINSTTDFAIAQLRYSEDTPEATTVIPPGGTATVTTVENGKAVAGIFVPPGTFSQTVTVDVAFVPLALGQTCHDYLLGQTGRCLHITATNADGTPPVLQQRATVGVCLSSQSNLHVDIFKFESRTDRPVALHETNPAFLDCTEFVGSVAPRGGFAGRALALAKRAGNFFTPTPLYAAHVGMGGDLGIGDGLSYFTWASPIQVSNALLAVNVLRSGKDVLAVSGTFDLTQKSFTDPVGLTGFDPARDAVIVGLGKHVSTIPVNSFKFSKELKQWVFAARTSSGVTGMVINPVDGKFEVAATVPTEGTALPTYRAFSLQIGNRAQGEGLLCATSHLCVAQEP